MNNDNTQFFGGGGFGGINKARVMKTVFVPISKPTQTNNAVNEQVYKEPITRKRTIRKRAPKKKAQKKRQSKIQVKTQVKKTKPKKNKIEKFQNF